jgi:menaquinone-specific isochorismate synthase
MSTRIHSCSARSHFIGQINPLEWLEAQTLFPKVYWKGKDGIELAAVGSMLTLNEFPTCDGIFFGGCAFFQEKFGHARGHGHEKREGGIWEEFPSTLFFQPKAILKEGVLTVFSSDNLEEYLVKKKRMPKLVSRKETPSYERWRENLMRCLQEKDLEKVVLARQVSLEFEDEIDPFLLVDKLRENAKNATVFALQLSPFSTFLGATPETFYQRDKGRLTTHALAGTRKRGVSSEEDERLRKELLTSDKESREFQYVKQFLSKQLSSLCDECEEHPVQIAQNSTLQHLVCNFSGELKNAISDREIFKALHPTPAVGGTPREKALDLISQLEDFERGWYASPIGWMSQEKAEFAVGIRSALIRKNEMHLFSGTGIVKGSIPEEEWEELEAKLKLFIEMF